MTRAISRTKAPKADADAIVEAALPTHPLLAGCASSTIDAVRDAGRAVVFAPGDELSREGEEADYWLLCKGSVRVFYRSPSGAEVTVKLFAAPAAWAEMEVLTKHPHIEDCAAVDKGVALRIPAAKFLALLDREPRFLRNVLDDTAARFFIAAQGEKRLAFAPVPERTAHLLLAYVRMYGVPVDDGVWIRVKLSQADIAQGIGAAQKSVTRTLVEWTRAGLIAKRGKSYVVKDVAALEEVIQHDVAGIDFVAGGGVRRGRAQRR
jgi:CRP-like cAMP-binding protein